MKEIEETDLRTGVGRDMETLSKEVCDKLFGVIGRVADDNNLSYRDYWRLAMGAAYMLLGHVCIATGNQWEAELLGERKRMIMGKLSDSDNLDTCALPLD